MNTTTLTLHAGWQRFLSAAAQRLRAGDDTATESAVVLEARRQAAAVRALADRHRRHDPGFANDLYAAADRYEGSVDASISR